MNHGADVGGGIHDVLHGWIALGVRELEGDRNVCHEFARHATRALPPSHAPRGGAPAVGGRPEGMGVWAAVSMAGAGERRGTRVTTEGFLEAKEELGPSPNPKAHLEGVWVPPSVRKTRHVRNHQGVGSRRNGGEGPAEGRWQCVTRCREHWAERDRRSGARGDLPCGSPSVQGHGGERGGGGAQELRSMVRVRGACNRDVEGVQCRRGGASPKTRPAAPPAALFHM
eukprot:1169595-Heterocapsa_arctica.AAC.1